MYVLLYGLQSPVNVGMILRSAEAFGIASAIFDPSDIFSSPAKRDVVSDFACGALERGAPPIYRRAGDIPARIGGRNIATSTAPDALAISGFRWREDDVIWLGNEYDGLPGSVEVSSDVRLTIPMPHAYLPKPKSFHPIDPTRKDPVSRDGTPNLNVAVAGSIIFYLANAQSVG